MLETMITEVREEFQIPPYFPNEGILNYLKEGDARLKFLNPIVDEENDVTFKMLLKNYVYYAYHHKVNEFEENYGPLILSWQMGAERK